MTYLLLLLLLCFYYSREDKPKIMFPRNILNKGFIMVHLRGDIVHSYLLFRLRNYRYMFKLGYLHMI